MTASPTCAHGISLAEFCAQLHVTDQPRRDSAIQPACPHGISLDAFCANLHGQEES